MKSVTLVGYIVRMAVALSCALALSSCAQAGPRQYKAKVVNTYSHDTKSYTQGLFIHDGVMYESTGQYGESTLRTVDISTGESSNTVRFSDKYFIEGSVLLDGKIYLLTWTNQVAFVYDAATLKYEMTYSYPREGWGLTTDGTHLIASDGSASIYFMTKDFRQVRRINVRLDGRPLRFLNELEYIDGRIWANVYTTDLIAVINPEDGQVEEVIDCSGILPQSLRTPDTDVLNGIAYDKASGKIYITGKYWPRLFEIVKEKADR